MRNILVSILCLFLGVCISSKRATAQLANMSDSLELVAFYNSTNGAGWTNKTNWLTTTQLKFWYGVSLDANGRVIHLQLANNQLSGNLINFSLPFLKTFIVSLNQLTGSIPNYAISTLEGIDLAHNQLTGGLPALSLPALKFLYTTSNPIGGTIPVFNFPELTAISLFNNQLTGSLPTLNFPKIEHLNLNNNQLSGSLPSISDANYPLLKTFDLSDNQFTGNLPLYILPLVERFHVQGNQLTGTIPNFNFPKCIVIWLRDNQFTGTIPNFNFPMATQVFLNNNFTIGPVPNFSLPQTVELTLSMNNLNYSGLDYIEQHYPNAVYHPQKNFTLINIGCVLRAPVGGTLANNTYKWYRNGILVSTKMGDSTFKPLLTGDYHVVVTSATAFDLTLTSATLSVTAFAPEIGGPKTQLFCNLTYANISNIYQAEINANPGTTVVGWYNGQWDTTNSSLATFGQNYYLIVQNAAGCRDTGVVHTVTYPVLNIMQSTPQILEADFEKDTLGWTHYFKNQILPGGQLNQILLLSLQKNGNNIGSVLNHTLKVKAEVTSGAGSGRAALVINPRVTNPRGFFSMHRYWKIEPLNQPTPGQPIKIRNYFTSSDIIDMQGSIYWLGDMKKLNFYKVIGSDPNPVHHWAGATDVISIKYGPGATETTYDYNYHGCNEHSADYLVSSFSGGGGGATGNGNEFNDPNPAIVFSCDHNTLSNIQNGSGTVTSTTLDIGSINNIFDGNASTLARSANINPMVVTASFTNPVTVDSVRVIQSAGNGWFSLEAANTLADMNGQTGSYQQLVNMRPTINSVASTQTLTASKKIYRLTVRRTTGDNFVHLNEWRLFGKNQYTVDTLFTSPGTINMHPGWELFLDRPTAFQTPVVYAKQGTATITVDQTCMSWTVSDTSILQYNPITKRLKALKAGTANFVGIIGTNFFNTPVNVTRLVSAGQPDLSVRYIKRLPEIDYVHNSPNPTVDGWPAAGQTVTWRAHVRNWSGNTYQNVDYTWKKNGFVIASGMLSFAPDAELTAQIDLPWAFQRDSLEFVIDLSNLISESSELNNTLKIYTNALSANLYVEQSTYDYFHLHQHKLLQGTNSWDDWAQILHVKRWNNMFKNAIHPHTPNGVLDRIRIDSIVIVPDNCLPLYGGLASNNPNTNDKTVDLQWGFNKSLLSTTMYTNHTSANDGNPFFFEGSLLHELGHARYLIDTYGLDIDTVFVKIKEGNIPIINTPLMPIIAWNIVYYNKNPGLMSGTYNIVDEYDAAALNKIAYRRALCGNMNGPCNIGVYINDLPTNNFITFKDQNNAPIPYACVEIYRAAPLAGYWYGKNFDDNPDLFFSTNADGKAYVGRNPFSATNIVNTFGHSSMDIIVRIEKNGKVGYKVIEATDFNMEFWKGNTLNANYTFQVNMENCSNYAGSSCNCCSQNYWTGAVSTAWENPANWSCGNIPGPSTYVIINTGKPNYPVISSMASCKSVAADPGTSINIASGFKLDIAGKD